MENDFQNLPDLMEIDSEGNGCIDEFCLVKTFWGMSSLSRKSKKKFGTNVQTTKLFQKWKQEKNLIIFLKKNSKRNVFTFWCNFTRTYFTIQKKIKIWFLFLKKEKKNWGKTIEESRLIEDLR